VPKYKVKITRISYASREVEITADTPAKAVRVAHATAGDYLYDEFDATYDVDDINLADPNK
jgi:hypothetical protein